MGVVLLVIGLVGLTMTVLSLIGLDIDAAFDISFDFADSGIGLLSLLTPFVTGFGLIAGGLMMIKPGMLTDIAGFVLFALVLVSQWQRKKAQRAAA